MIPFHSLWHLPVILFLRRFTLEFLVVCVGSKNTYGQLICLTSIWKKKENYNQDIEEIEGDTNMLYYYQINSKILMKYI